MITRTSRTTARAVAAAVGAIALVAGTAGSASATHTRPLQAVLYGANEVAKGDPDGIGGSIVTANAARGRLCFAIGVANVITPTAAAHVHKGAVGKNGPIVVALTAPGASGSSRGCVTVKKALILDILRHPTSYYVNVHDKAYPAGAVRGQLS